MKHLEVQQGTPEWFNARLAKFTSSELHKLFTSGKRSMTEAELAAREKGDRRTTVDELFGETAKSYIREKVAEIMTNGASAEYSAFETAATEWGTSYEEEARNLFAEKTGLEVKTCGFFAYDDFFGGSPDGIVEDDYILEIKCPYNASKHVANLCCQDASDLKKLNPDYYIQMQGNMLATNAKSGFFVSFDPRFHGDFRIKIIVVDKDEAMIVEAKNRLAAAADMMNEILKKSMNV